MQSEQKPITVFMGTTVGWVVATFLGWIALIVTSAALFAPGQGALPALFTSLLAGVVAGAVAGAGQWLVLRRWFSGTGWIFAVIAGYGLAWLAIELLGASGRPGSLEGASMVVVWALGGAIVGLAQALAASQLRGVIWLVIATAAGWAVLALFARMIGDGNFVLGAVLEALITWVAALFVLAANQK